METKQTSKGSAAGLAIAAAVAAAGAGAYWLYGTKDASKNRKLAKSWMLKARGEVLEGVEKLKDIDKEKYLRIVDTVMNRYKKMSGVTAVEALPMAKNFKDSWQHMQKAAKPAKKAAKKAKKYAKKS
jgi:hypothetical protein